MSILSIDGFYVNILRRTRSTGTVASSKRSRSGDPAGDREGGGLKGEGTGGTSDSLEQGVMKPGEFVRRALLDKRAGRAGRVFDRAPELCEIGVRNGDGVELFVDRYQTRSLEDRDDLAGQAEFLRPNVGPVDRIDRRSGFGEKPEQCRRSCPRWRRRYTRRIW